jgi:hypothetical protein
MASKWDGVQVVLDESRDTKRDVLNLNDNEHIVELQPHQHTYSSESCTARVRFKTTNDRDGSLP